MNPIILQQPRRILFGSDTFKQTPAEVDLVGGRRVFVVTTGFLLEQARSLVADLRAKDIAAEIFSGIEIEPDIGLFKQVLEAGRTFDFDTVVGLGGGSVLDVAKLVGAFRTGSPAVEEAFGIGLLKGRGAGLHAALGLECR